MSQKLLSPIRVRPVAEGETMIVEKGIYAYLWQSYFENNCNSYILGKGQAILVDVGHKRHVSHLHRGMEADGVSLDRIDLIVITHCHPDHVEALPLFLDGRIKATCHREDEIYLRPGGALVPMMEAPAASIPIEFYLQEGSLQVGSDLYEIIHTPGHSPGAICIYWAEKKALVTGDLVFAGSVGRTDLPGGDGRQLIESIEKIRKLDLEILLPGHGEIILGSDRIQENFTFIEENYYAFV